MMDKEQGPTPGDYRDARGPEWRAIFDTLRDYRLSNMTYEGTSDEFYPLVDLMSNEGQGIDTGEMQMVELADEISLAVKTARRSSDEQAEVVGHQWRYRTDPPDAQWRTPSPADLEYVRSLPDKYEVRALFASPPAVAAGGVTEERVEAAMSAYWGASPGSRRTARDRMVDALLAALTVRDEGIREGWQPIEAAPPAMHVMACRFDHDAGEWVYAVVMSPPIHPFTHWRMLDAPPSRGGE